MEKELSLVSCQETLIRFEMGMMHLYIPFSFFLFSYSQSKKLFQPETKEDGAGTLKNLFFEVSHHFFLL